MIENIKLAFQGIWSHKMRSLLTMLGIIIGIAAIISIVSTIKGTNEQIKQNLIGSGTNVVNIALHRGEYAIELSYESVPDGVPVISEATRSQIASLEPVEDVSLYYKRSYAENVYFKNTSFNGALCGVDTHYLNVNQYKLTSGRDFSQHDYDHYRKVCLVDSVAVESLFQNEDPLGEIIEIKKEPFMVIGVIDQSSESKPVINSLNDYYLYVGNQSGNILIPDVQWSELFRYDEPQSVCVKAFDTDSMTKAGQQTANILNHTLTVSPDSDVSYKSSDITEQAQKLQALSNSTNMQLIWIASISLLVGGIGVMNIMLVSVTERTKEIGLKKAIGAREGRILWQFLTEASVLTSVGGILGVLSGIGLSQVISQLTGTPTAISIPAVLIAVVFSMLIGIVFGLLPALKAARLNPIDALRRD